MKALLYILTTACAFFFAFWEMKLKRDFTSGVLERNSAISDIGLLDNVTKEVNRERFLANLPEAMRRKLRVIVTLKLVAVGVLVLEVLLLQR